MEFTSSGRKRPRAAPEVSEEVKQEEHQLQDLERRLEGVRSTKQVLQEQLNRLNAESSKLELLARQSQQQADAQATKLTRMEQLQADAAKRREEVEARRIEQEAARRKREEDERARRERTVDVTFKADDDDLATLENFLAHDAAGF
jgi:chromosome segregation ATPase